jgi:hypothetical protein
VCLVESGRCTFSVCVVSLLSSRFTASALVWFSDFPSICYSNEHCVHLQIFMQPEAVRVPRCVQDGSESLGLKALGNFDVAIGGRPPVAEFHKSLWV